MKRPSLEAPASVHQILKRIAGEDGRSVKARATRVLEEAQQIERNRRLKELIPELKRFAASVGPMEDCCEIIREHRDS